MSDLSGSGSEDGYDTYLTGYPLPGIAKFAFARTWYAEEMSRPGCVWTHTLLVSFSDLAHLNPVQLRYLFERPSPEAKRWTFYEEKRRFPESDALLSVGEEQVPVDAGLWADEREQAPSSGGQAAEVLIDALYGKTAERPILAIAPSSSALESAVLQVWGQQWPGLKRRFSFCTGSLSNRELKGKPLDLQVVPPSRRRAVERGAKSFSVVSPFDAKDRDESYNSQKRWIEAAAEDLKPASDLELRNHLRFFGADVESGRTAFEPLVESFVASKGGGHQADMIDLLGESFPQKTEAGKLKGEALRKQSSLFPDANPQNERAVLLRLAETTLHEAFDYDDLGVRKRVREACREVDRGGPSVLAELLKSKLNLQGQRMLGVAIDASGIDELVRLAGEAPEKWWPVIFDRQPLVAAKPDFWKAVSGRSEVYITALAQTLGSDREAWGRVVAAAIVAEADDVVKPLEINLDFATSAFLDGFEKAGSKVERRLSYKWKRLMRNDVSAVERWLAEKKEMQTHTALLITDVFSPDRIDTANAGLQSWENAVEKAQTHFSMETKEFFALMAFALALSFQSEEGSKLAAKSFQYVHRAAARNKLDWRSWRWVRRSLPDSRGHWKDIFDWDRCEELRRGLILCWAKRGWALEDLVEAAGSPATLREVLDSMDRTPEGRQLLHELDRSFANERDRYSNMQKNVLEDSFGGE